MIPGFPTVGGVELLILLAIILLLFGARRIPELARSLGRGAREFRKEIGEARGEAQDREEKSREESSSGKTVTLDPSARLAKRKTYTVKTVGATDKAGNALPDKVWSFKTGRR